jgi:hypothetical protein
LGILHRVVWWKFAGVSGAPAASIVIAIMKVASTPVMSANVYQTTRRSTPDGSHLHTRRLENTNSDINMSMLHNVIVLMEVFLF